MKLSQYNYNVSPELLAQYPVEHRDDSRMLVLHRKTGEIEHKFFKDIINYFEEEDVFILNNTKVFP
ncbi:MAG: S-adenosylmethionine:tRNA ribosyltransferase-isomerase, partial [Tidjanibacter sp.]|nr:S-adenosylmethionine:tRNA ribosyltransferase-isomerase [Tidjanibacter sp.]